MKWDLGLGLKQPAVANDITAPRLPFPLVHLTHLFAFPAIRLSSMPARARAAVWMERRSVGSAVLPFRPLQVNHYPSALVVGPPAAGIPHARGRAFLPALAPIPLAEAGVAL
jgi:hypothetical protein